MSRPTHAMQQQEVDDALAALPTKRWRWLFTPDPRWLASVNTTTYREVNAVRMFVLVTLVFVTVFVGVVGFALTRCGVYITLLGYQVFQILPPPGKLGSEAWKICEQSLMTSTLLDFASTLFNGYGLLLAAMATVAVGGNILKRVTDTEHQVEVNKAKKAPINVLPSTAEHQAQQPPIQQIVNVGEDAVEAIQGKPALAERPVVDEKPAEEPEWAKGDPRKGIL